MNRTSPATPDVATRAGFTLIELLVVISIIAVLAAILMPIIGKVQYSSRKVQSVNDMRNIKVSIISYYNDYQKYPITPGQELGATHGYAGNPDGFDTCYGDPGQSALYSTADLFDILRALDIGPHHSNVGNVLNPSQTVYWTGQTAKSLVAPHGGISQADVTWKDHIGKAYTIYKGSFMDPWGRSYIIFIDATKDGDFSAAGNWFYLDIPADKGTIVTGQPPLGIGAASMGGDGFWGTVSSTKPYGDGIASGSDDIVVWR